MEVLNYLNSGNIDIIFLDINMPKIDGLSFIKTLKSPPKVIITSAYRVDFENILFIETVGDCIKIISNDKSLLIYMNLKNIESVLPYNQFIHSENEN